MPISQITVLALYGELRRAISLIEQAAVTLNVDKSMNRATDLQRSMADLSSGLLMRAREIERAGIAVLLQDAPQIKVNPLTGEAE